MIVYIQNPGSNLREVWASAKLDADDDDSPALHELVSYSTFEGYSKRQGWSKKRQDHWSEIERRVLEEAKTDAVQRELREIEILDAVGTVLIGNITGITDAAGNVIIQGALPKSLEGAVTAFIKLDQHRMGKRDRVMKVLAQAAGDHEGSSKTSLNVVPSNPEIEDNLSDAELRQLAHALVDQRAANPEEPADDNDETPEATEPPVEGGSVSDPQRPTAEDDPPRPGGDDSKPPEWA
jgi:hypothetical protein